MFCISEPFKETLVPSIWTNTVYETSPADILETSPVSNLESTTKDTVILEIFTTEDPIKVTSRSNEVTTFATQITTEVQEHKTTSFKVENSTPSTNTELITVETEANITSKTENDTKEWDSRENILKNFMVLHFYQDNLISSKGTTDICIGR